MKVTVDLPTKSGESLLNAYERNDPELFKYLAPLVLLDVSVEKAGMSISILSTKYFTLDLLGHYVFFRFDQGKLQAREVYDLFFTPSSDWDNARFICISPHALIQDNKLLVSAVPAPGAGSQENGVYDSPVGFGREFCPDTQVFSAKIQDLKNLNNPSIFEISGRVIVPEISLPASIENDPSAIEVMSKCGTIFELRLPQLKANVSYAMRLVLKPFELLGLSSPRNLDEYELKSINVRWRQNASISSTEHCWSDYWRLLEKTKQTYSPFAASAATIQAIIADPTLTMTRAKRIRVLLVLPPGCDLYRERAIGTILPLGPVNTPDSRSFYEYYGGIERFWVDDIESLGRGIWSYLRQWAGTEPKTKEQITTTLGVQHDNCCLIVDAMLTKEVVGLVDLKRGLYKACDVSEEKLNRALEDIATDHKVINKFSWAGYIIQFRVEYTYLSRKDKWRLYWQKIMPILAFWLALAGVILALLALLL